MLLPCSVLSEQVMDKPINVVDQKKVLVRGEQTHPKKNDTSTNLEKNVSSLVEKPSVNNPANTPKKYETKEPSPVNNGWNTSNTFMVIFTAILAVCTFGMWQETKKIVRTTKDTAERQLRAYVGARLADGENVFIDKNGCLSVPIIVENYGQTPAHNFKKSVFVNTFKLPIKSVLDPPEYKGCSVTCIFPGQKTRMYPTLPRPLNNAEINSIKNKEGCFCVWGYLEYVDIFGNAQTSEFRMFSTGDDLERGELAYSEEGNTAT